MYYLYSKKTRKGYAMRHHCINKKRSRMAVYNGNKQTRQQDLRCIYKHVANGWFRTIAPVRMFHVQINISNRTRQSGVLLHDVIVEWLSRSSQLITQHDGQYRVYNSPLPLAVLNHIHFNINLPSMPSSSHWSLPFGLPEQNSVSISQCWL
jgi:hypothetical protein